MPNEISVFENEFDASGVSTIVCNDLNSKTTIMTCLLHEYGILKRKEILFYTFERRCDFYYRHLLARISKINKSLLVKYLYPWLGLSHNNTDMINRFYFVGAIEKIQQSNLFMIGDTTKEEDYLDNILNMLEFDTSTIIVIEDFDLLLKKTKYSRKETLRKIKEYSKKYEAHFILVCNKNDDILESNTTFQVSIMEKYPRNKMRTLHIKKYQNKELQRRIILEYNKNNYQIEKRGEK